jgi:predicted RNA-binding Zn-ribbon protein involved in translation (DUF1610 family)
LQYGYDGGKTKRVGECVMGWEYREPNYITASISTDCVSCEVLYEGDAEYGEGVACWHCPNCGYDNETERE